MRIDSFVSLLKQVIPQNAGFEQVKNKWTSMERVFKKTKNNNKKTGRDRQTTTYHR